MTVRVGDVVIFREVKGDQITREPAVVTRVWGPDCVNVTVLPDCGAPVSKTSIARLFAVNADVGMSFVER